MTRNVSNGMLNPT